jgi:phage shock protein A
MDVKEKIKFMEEFSNLAISGLKKLSEDGQKLTQASLVKVLKDMPAAQSMAERVEGGKKDVKSGDGEAERLKSQKEKLIRQLDDLEEKFSEAEKVYKRIMMFLAEWVKTETGGVLDEQIKQFKDVLNQRTNVELLEDVFSKLKTKALHADLAEDGKGEKKKSLVARLFSIGGNAELEQKYIAQFRTTFQEIVNELGLDLGVDFLPKLLHLGKRINSSLTFDDFSGLRKDILELQIGRASCRERVS